jgi:hypothetical protein
MLTLLPKCDSLALGGGYAAMTCATAGLLLSKLVYCLLFRSTRGQLLLSLQLLSTPMLHSVLCSAHNRIQSNFYSWLTFGLHHVLAIPALSV